MTAELFAKILRISPSTWSLVVGEKRNLSFKKAEITAHILGTKTDLWVNPTPPARARKEAWLKFQSEISN